MGKKYRELWEHDNFGRFVMQQSDGTTVQYQIAQDMHLIPGFRLAIHSHEEAEAYLNHMVEYCNTVGQDKRFPANVVATIRVKIFEARKALTKKGLDEAKQYLAVIPHLTVELERAPLVALGRYGKQKHKETSARGGSAPKALPALAPALATIIAERPDATAVEVCAAVPESHADNELIVKVAGIEYRVYRDGKRIVQLQLTLGQGENVERNITLRTCADVYVPKARELSNGSPDPK